MNKKGFTLIELLITIVIIGILASIAVPMMRTNIDSAKKTEAVAAMGAIRTAERLYYAGNGAYVSVTNTAAAWDASALNTYIKSTDLVGRFYNATCYSVSGDVITCTAGANAPAGGTMNISTGETT